MEVSWEGVLVQGASVLLLGLGVVHQLLRHIAIGQHLHYQPFLESKGKLGACSGIVSVLVELLLARS